MNLKDSDVNHLRRLLGFIRCEVGQSPDEMVATVQTILPAIGDPSEEGKTRLVRSYLKSAAIPEYVRAAIKALEKTLAENPPVRAESNFAGAGAQMETQANPVCQTCGLFGEGNGICSNPYHLSYRTRAFALEPDCDDL